MPDDTFHETSLEAAGRSRGNWRNIEDLNDDAGAGCLQVLIVEDQYLNSEFLRIWVEALGHKVCGIAKSADAAWSMALRFHPDLILMDYLLEGEGDGADAARVINSTHPIPIVFVTASVDEKSVNRILAVKPLRVLSKPVHPEELSEVLSLVSLDHSAAAA